MSFAIYVAFLLLSLRVSPDGAGSLDMKGRMIGIAVFLGMNGAFSGLLLGRLRAGGRGSSLVFYLFWISVTLVTPFARSAGLSFAYVVLTVAVYVSAGNVWVATPGQRRWMAAVIAVVCFGFCLRPILIYGLGEGRGVGHLGPNDVAMIASTPVLLAFLLPGYGRALVYLPGLALILYVNARGSLLAVLAFIGIYEMALVMIHRRWKALVGAMGVAGIVGPAVVMAILAVPAIREAAFAPINYALALDDKYRGVGSGLTGRTGFWSAHADELAENLVTGIGFRGSKAASGFDTAHSGLYDLLRECGVLSSSLFVLFVGLRISQLVRCMCWQSLSMEARETAAGVMAATSAVMLLAAVEPQLINIGYPIGVTGLLLYAFHEPLPSERSLAWRPVQVSRAVHTSRPEAGRDLVRPT